MRALRATIKAVLRLLAGAIAVLFGWARSAEPVRRPEPIVELQERDIDHSRGAESLVALLLVLGALGFAGFIVFYVVNPDTQLLGLCIGLGIVFAGVALAIAGKKVVPQEKATDEYHDFGDKAQELELERTVIEGAEGVTRRRLLWMAGGTAAAVGGAAAVVPLASLGPSVGDRISATPWKPGRRIVDDHGEPIRADDLEEAMFLSGFPEASSHESIGAPLILIRLPEDELELPPGREDSAPGGILAFSKICPHAACAISMYRHPKFEPTEPSPALVCPCHYSTFDPRRAGALEFGPAGRALPQLPVQINSRGELEAAGDFYTPPGPSYSGSRSQDPNEETS